MSTGAGKGSKPRPFSVDHQTYASNWERAFGKKSSEEDICAYSGLPTTASYEDVYDRVRRQEELKSILDSFGDV